MLINCESPDAERFKAIIERVNAERTTLQHYGEYMELIPLKEPYDYCDIISHTICAYATSGYEHVNYYSDLTKSYVLCVGLTASGDVLVHVYTSDEKLDTIYLPVHLSKTEDLEHLEELLLRSLHIMAFGRDRAEYVETQGGYSHYWKSREELLEEIGYVNHGSTFVENSACDLESYHLTEASYANSITFGGEQEPEDGWVLILSGGPCSGKSLVLEHKPSFKSKVFCSAEVDLLCHELGAIANNKETALFPNREDRLPNFTLELFSGGYRHQEKLQQVFRALKGIKTKPDGRRYKIAYCFVVTNRELAIINNICGRKRWESDGSFRFKHSVVDSKELYFLKYEVQNLKVRNINAAWIYINPINDERLRNQNPELASWVSQNRAIKLHLSCEGWSISRDVEMKIHDILGP